MYGIPNMKLDKEEVVQRRVDLMAAEGITFKTKVHIGTIPSGPPKNSARTSTPSSLLRRHPRPRSPDRGARRPGHPSRDGIPHREHPVPARPPLRRHDPALNAKGKDVVVIGGGDTGTDCVGTSLRHGCKSVIQLEIMPSRRWSAPRTIPGPNGPRSTRWTTARRKPPPSRARTRASIW